MQKIFSKEKYVNITILLIAVGYFVLMGFPNAVGSEDLGMIKIFEPDEGVPLPYLFDMIKPAISLGQAAYNFVDYNYYFYGFPYFAFSAVVIYPLKLITGLGKQYPQVMLLLRQMVSTLPVIVTAYLLVKMQTGLKRSGWSIFLFVFLLAVPAVIRNNFWWHPDGLSVLLVVVVIWLLNKDDLTFSKYFFWAAVVCGILTGIKYTGLYFVLTIPVYLIWGVVAKKITLKRMILYGLAFVALMALGVLVSNPLLIFSSPRHGYLQVFRKQSGFLQQGYEVIYDRGLQAAAPTIHRYYGSWSFLAVALLAPVVGVLTKKERLLNVILLTWAIPLTVYVLTLVHFKFQYWLPVALPLFSGLLVFLPDFGQVRRALAQKEARQLVWPAVKLGAMAVIFIQLLSFAQIDIDLYTSRLNRVETSASIQFYSAVLPYLEPLEGQDLLVYHDTRLYVPDKSPWKTIAYLELLTYSYFKENDPDVILLMQQRIRDYLNPEVTGIDPLLLKESRQFYGDADRGEVWGYVLVYRNDFGLAFVRENLYEQFFKD